MKRYIYKEIEIAKEYRYIFLCGTHYGKKSKSDKRNVLREFLKGESQDYSEKRGSKKVVKKEEKVLYRALKRFRIMQ